MSTAAAPSIERILRVSTAHMPDLREDLTDWHTGAWPTLYNWERCWVFCYEEDPSTPEAGKICPQWLLDLCKVARNTYGCDWILLDPDGDEIPGVALYH